jgi:hypothetical protein
MFLYVAWIICAWIEGVERMDGRQPPPMALAYLDPVLTVHLPPIFSFS